jgi:hypothetical protein
VDQLSQRACSHSVLADRIGVYNTIVIGNAILAVMLWVWLACKTLGSCVALCVIVGIASGAFVSLQSPVANKTSTDPLKAGTLLGQAVCELLGGCSGWDES